MFRFELPFGYDVGFYRYLFIRHAEAFPPFWITNLEPWARAHPLGLFFFSTIFLRLGIPVDWLIGWIWNFCAVILFCTLAWVTAKKYGRNVGIWTLVASLLSVATFDGFAAMYMETFAALFWMVLTFHAIEKRSWWSIPLGIITVITHNQTGLLFGLSLISYAILPFIPWVRPTAPLTFKTMSRNEWLFIFGGGLLIFILGVITYLPILNEAILSQLPALLGKTEAAAGNFPPALFYLSTETVVLCFAAFGFILQAKKERWSLWQLSVLWSLLFVALHLLFYRRFFLQLDFFLLPFAGIGFQYVWHRWKTPQLRCAFLVLLAVQLFAMKQAILRDGPMASDVTFHGILQIGQYLPDNAFVLSLDDQTPVLLRGWYPYHKVGGPGLFDAPQDIDQWKSFLLGTHADRIRFLQQLPAPVYVFASEHFHDYYGQYGDNFLKDSCFEQTQDPMLYRVTCL